MRAHTSSPVNFAPWVVIAALNEEQVVGEVVAGVIADGWQVVVVDDGSADATSDQARGAGAVVLRHVLNRGQGAALQTGIDYALGRGATSIVTFDADGQHHPGDIASLLAAVEDGVDVALGSRFLGTVEGIPRSRLWLLKLATQISRLQSGLALTDTHCGLRAMRAEAAHRLRLRQDRFAHASEFLVKLGRSGLRWREVPVTVRYTAYSQAKGQRASGALRILLDQFVRNVIA